MSDYQKPYMTFSRRIVMAVRCKGSCMRTLMVRRGIGQNLRVDSTKDYGEIQIEMRDGDGTRSMHQTAMCKACRTRLLSQTDVMELEDIFAQDLRQWVTEAIILGSTRKEAERMASRFVWRHPTGLVVDVVA